MNLFRMAGMVVLAATVTVAPVAAQARGGAAGGCDRACLIGVADAYFTALGAKDASRAPLAPDARFTENAQVLTIGAGGLWSTATEPPTTFKIYVPDPVSGQVGGIVTMRAGGIVEVAFRLKVEDRQITEAEHLVAPIMGEAQIANLQTPRPGLLQEVSPGERLPREILALFAHGYYDAIEQSDGDLVPFADECVRRENGMHTAGPRPAGQAAPGRRGTPSPAAARGNGRGRGTPGGGVSFDAGAQTCAGQLDTRFMSYIEDIDLRRVWIADPVRGLVFGLSMFRHPMEERTLSKTLTIINPDGTRGQRPMDFEPFDFASAHVIKVRDNKIYDIEAMGVRRDYLSTNGWTDLPR